MGDKLKSTEDHFVNKRRDLRGINKTFFLCLELFWLPYARHRDHVKAKLGLLTFTLQYLFFFSKTLSNSYFLTFSIGSWRSAQLNFYLSHKLPFQIPLANTCVPAGTYIMNLPSNAHHGIHVDRYQTNVIQVCSCLYGWVRISVNLARTLHFDLLSRGAWDLVSLF